MLKLFFLLSKEGQSAAQGKLLGWLQFDLRCRTKAFSTSIFDMNYESNLAVAQLIFMRHIVDMAYDISYICFLYIARKLTAV